MSNGPILNKLVGEDIDEKIFINQKQGVDILTLEKLIKEEMKDFIWTKIRCEVQIQFYTEQLEHIARRIKEIKTLKIDNPYKSPEYKSILAKIPL